MIGEKASVLLTSPREYTVPSLNEAGDAAEEVCEAPAFSRWEKLVRCRAPKSGALVQPVQNDLQCAFPRTLRPRPPRPRRST